MKKIVILLTIAFTALTSCFKDKSASDYAMLNPIMINLGPGNDFYNTNFSLYQLDTLKITPIAYKEGVKDADLSFKWTMMGNYMIPKVIGTNMTLKEQMTVAPYATAYTLIYEVTDNATGISIEQVFYITILSPFGTGLVVSDTRDELSGDISLITALNFKSGTKRDTVMRDLFSQFHHRKIEAPTTSVLSSKYGSTAASLTIATKQSIERVNPYDYSYMDKNEQMFIIPPTKFNVLAVVNDANSGYDLINNDGKIHNRAFQSGGKNFGYPYATQDFTPYNAGLVCKPYWNSAIVFDDLGGRFLILNQSKGRLNFPPIVEGAPFNYDQFKEYDCISITTAPSNKIYCIMRHKTTGKIFNYIFITGYDLIETKSVGILTYDTGRCPEIGDATGFTACESGGTLYYSTKNKIYGVNGTIDNDLLVTSEYEVPEGEIITDIMAWSNYKASGQIKMTNPDPNAAPDKKIQTISSQNRMIVITTYNPTTKEGFIRTVAVSNVPKGTLEKDRNLHGVFGGFGRITCISFQQ